MRVLLLALVLAEARASSAIGEELVNAVRTKMQSVLSLVDAQAREVVVAYQLSNRSIEHVEANEDGRQSVLITYNGAVATLNGALAGMTMGVRQINNAIDVAARVRNMVDTDIGKLNRNVEIMDMWMEDMEKWADFVTTETTEMTAANERLLTWGDSTKETVNEQEVSILDLGTSVDNLETEIVTWHESINAIGRMFDYQPDTLSVPEAAAIDGASLSPTYALWS